MIQVTGTITANDGLSKYENPLLNLNITHANKFAPVCISVDVFTHNNNFFKKINTIVEFKYNIQNPTFEGIQSAVLADLQTMFETITFDVV